MTQRIDDSPEDDVLGSPRRNARMSGVNRDPETYAVIGAAMEIHRELGPGFLEGVYQDALQFELFARGVPFVREHPIPVNYKGTILGTPYRADFLCYGLVLVELKAVKTLTAVEDAQVLHYLKATGFERAVLLNFGAESLEYKRLVRGFGSDPDRKPQLAQIHGDHGRSAHA